jgi:hypothetical protein
MLPFVVSRQLRGGSGEDPMDQIGETETTKQQDDVTETHPKVLLPIFPHVEYPSTATTTTQNQRRPALIFMDVFCDYHGHYVAERARQVYGVTTIQVLSEYMKGYFLLQQQQQEQLQQQNTEYVDPQEKDQIEWYLSRSMPSTPQTAKEWSQSLRDEGYDFVGIVCESDAGLADADRLGELLNVTYRCSSSSSSSSTNDETRNEKRRNKYLQQQAVRDAGVAVVQQCLCKTEQDAVDFAKRLGVTTKQQQQQQHDSTVPRVVAKPVRYVSTEHNCFSLSPPPPPALSLSLFSIRTLTHVDTLIHDTCC